MKYLIILLFLSGCATNNVARINQSQINNVKITESDIGYNDSYHRRQAEELGIQYVDYLHLVNNNKISVKQSYFKLRHKNN
jgi:hypothetical protein